MNEKALDAADEATEDEINSSTHRAAHARLNRRMEKLDPATFPQMSKLWNGTRKDYSFRFEIKKDDLIFVESTTSKDNFL